MAKQAETKAKTAGTKKAIMKKVAPKPKKVEIQTKENESSVGSFIDAVDDAQKRQDAFEILEMMKKATKAEPKMWGSSLIGFGNRLYTSPATGRQVDWFYIGFSPRKANITLYVLNGSAKQNELLGKLGKYTTGKGCLYIKRLADVDKTVLKQLVDESAKNAKTV